MAGGDVDACLTAVFPDGEAQLRGGAQGLENADMDAVGGADLSGGAGKLHGVVPAVHADGNASALALRTLGGNDVGKALGRPADDMDVHIVKARVHGSPQTGGAELQRAEEPAFDFLGIVPDGLQLGVFRRGEGGAVKPLFVFLHEIHL